MFVFVAHLHMYGCDLKAFLFRQVKRLIGENGKETASKGQTVCI